MKFEDVLKNAKDQLLAVGGGAIIITLFGIVSLVTPSNWLASVGLLLAGCWYFIFATILPERRKKGGGYISITNLIGNKNAKKIRLLFSGTLASNERGTAYRTMEISGPPTSSERWTEILDTVLPGPEDRVGICFSDGDEYQQSSLKGLIESLDTRHEEAENPAERRLLSIYTLSLKRQISKLKGRNQHLLIIGAKSNIEQFDSGIIPFGVEQTDAREFVKELIGSD